MRNNRKYVCCQVFGWLMCIGVPLTVTCSYFPVWIARSSEMTVAGGTVVLLLLCVIPFFKQIKQWFSKSPASWIVWTIIAGMCIVVRTIIDQLVIVACFGAVSNILGGLIFYVGKRYQPIKEVLNA